MNSKDNGKSEFLSGVDAIIKKYREFLKKVGNL